MLFPIIPFIPDAVSPGTYTNRYVAAGGLITLSKRAGFVSESVLTTKSSLVLAAQSFVNQGLTDLFSNGGLMINGSSKTSATQSLFIGKPLKAQIIQSADVTAGESVLIVADIIQSGLENGGEESSIQTITLNGAISGTWSIWLTYGGYVLETASLPFNASAAQVKDALTALTNVPSAASIEVTSTTVPGSKTYRFEFRDLMANRYIAPLVVETSSLVGTAEVTVEQAGTANGVFRDALVDAKLYINDVEIPIEEFDYQEPRGKFGALLNCKLSIPDVNQAPINSVIDFDLIANGTPRRLISNGKLASRNYRIARSNKGGPADEVTISVLDVVADKATLAPRRPVIMFDPAKTSFGDVEIKAPNAVITKDGLPILPVYEHVGGLTMKSVLARGYTGSGGYSMLGVLDDAALSVIRGLSGLFADGTNDQVGLGFSSVVTNIKDYPVKRAEFGIESGWHKGAEPFIGMYDPLFLPFGNILCIVSKEFPLPFGATPRVVRLSDSTSINETVPFKSDTNAVLLTFQSSLQDDITSATFEEVDYVYETNTNGGLFGNIGYSETRISTKYTRIKNVLTREVISERVDEVITQTREHLEPGLIGTGGMTLIHEEILTNQYDSDGLKRGHNKTVKSLLPVGTAVELIAVTLPVVLTENCQIIWKDDPANLGQKIQNRCITRTTGLCYIEGTVIELTDVNGATHPYNKRWPVLVAENNGVIASDFAGDSLGTMATLPVETTTETLRRIQGNQYDCQVVTIDHLNSTVKRSVVAPRTGNASTNPYETRSKTMLLTDPVSEALIGPRVPISVNAGELPRSRSIELGNNVLYRASNPLHQTSFTLAEVDFGIAKGTVIIGQTRYAYTTRHIVAGITISGNNLRSKGHQIVMTLEADETA